MTFNLYLHIVFISINLLNSEKNKTKNIET